MERKRGGRRTDSSSRGARPAQQRRAGCDTMQEKGKSEGGTKTRVASITRRHDARVLQLRAAERVLARVSRYSGSMVEIKRKIERPTLKKLKISRRGQRKMQ